ncbi:MAG: PHP domain-containing protein [Pontiellaceae bacterium]|nr:PHP domain-containing protein [Pontiellaceae bacterium]
MKKARIDFHIHSCLSPCASLEMSPRAIVARARKLGLDCIALADHCCAENLPAFHDACREVDLPCLYGMEVCSEEEVHVLCLFDQLEPALEFGRIIYNSLQDFPNNPERFGDQPIVSVEGDILDFAEKLLIGSTSISFFDLVPMALDAGALCIPSHIDRDCYGALAHLGFLPDLPYSAVEVVARSVPAAAADWPVVRFSDAHCLNHLGRRYTELKVDEFTVPSLCAAFAEQLQTENKS